MIFLITTQHSAIRSNKLQSHSRTYLPSILWINNDMQILIDQKQYHRISSHIIVSGPAWEEKNLPAYHKNWKFLLRILFQWCKPTKNHIWHVQSLRTWSHPITHTCKIHTFHRYVWIVTYTAKSLENKLLRSCFIHLFENVSTFAKRHRKTQTILSHGTPPLMKSKHHQ